MELEAKFEKKVFKFKRPSGTSRGVLTEKLAWFIYVWDKSNPEVIGIGECSVISGLSPDFKNSSAYENKVSEVIENINHFRKRIDLLENYPSIYFGLEMALLDINNGGKRIYFDTSFTNGTQKLPINGLVWMGDISFMKSQIEEKINQGFECIKLKIGALDFNSELALLENIRKNFDKDQITLRVDANGAFRPEEALKKLYDLSNFDIHSIEQPIEPNHHEEMFELCQKSPIPIALDEELINITEEESKEKLLNSIKPQYIILKPSLIGGFKGTLEWIKYADRANIKWWITSALESNIGLDAISQFTSTFDIELPQGLGTGSLYENNIPSKLYIVGGNIYRKV